MTWDWYVTGHRPDKLFAEKPYALINHARLSRFAGSRLEKYKAESVVTGMALGWDLAVAGAARTLGIPYLAAVPCEGQESKWPAEAQRHYRELLAGAQEIVVVTPGPFKNGVMHARNAWMVEHGANCLALWNGDEKGGTAHAIELAERAEHRIVNCWFTWLRWRDQ